MVLLPIAGSFGVLVVPEIILVLRLGQPSPHELAFPGLAAVGLEAITLALSTPAIGKKKLLAVQALASGLGRLHWFQNKKEPVSETRAEERKKIQPEEELEGRRRKKSFQRICRIKSKGRRSHSKPPILHPFDFALGRDARHLNRFGDGLLFTGRALMTDQPGCLINPTVLAI